LLFFEISSLVFALSRATDRRCNASHDNAYIAKRQALKTCCHVSPIVRGSKVTVSKRWPSQFSGSSAHKGLNDARAQAQRVCSPAPAGQRAQAQRHSPITATPAEDTGQDVAAAKERISSAPHRRWLVAKQKPPPRNELARGWQSFAAHCCYRRRLSASGIGNRLPRKPDARSSSRRRHPEDWQLEASERAC